MEWLRRGVVESFAFQPPPSSYSRDSLRALEWASRTDGRPDVPIIYHTHDDAANDSECPVVIYSHGNSTDLGQVQRMAIAFAAQFKVNVATYEYDGYGILGRHGECTEEGCYSAIHACYNYLVTTRKIAPERIVLHGHSLGTGPTVELALRLTRNASGARPYAGCILQSALQSCLRVALSFSWSAVDKFCNIDKIGDIAGPLLFVHGDSDLVISYKDTLELAARARAPTCDVCIIRGAAHNDIETFKYEWGKAVQDFMDGVRSQRP